MLAAYRRSAAFPAEIAIPVQAPAASARFPEVEVRAAFDRPNWTAIAVVVLLHVGLLTALVQLDVIPIGKPRPDPTVITLIPDTTPAPPPEEKTVPLKPVQPEIVVPQAVVPIAAPPPPPVMVAATPPPPQAIVVAAPTAKPGPAPVTAPDGSAASLKNPSPRYPIEARRRHEEGTVRLRVVITEDGRVKDIGVARSSGFERLDQAALDAVRRWKFVPGMQAGQPVEAIGFLNIPFKLSA